MDGTVEIAQFEEGIARLSRVLVHAAGREVLWLERIRSGLAALLAFLEDHPAWGRLLLIDALAAGPQVLERRRAALGALVEVVDAGRTERTVGSWSLSSPPRLMAEGVVGAVFSVLHARMLEQREHREFRALTPSLMAMIVLPYLGRVAASAELNRRPAASPELNRRPAGARLAGRGPSGSGAAPMRATSMPIRTTHRTGLVLSAIAQVPGSSNREIASAAGLRDEGQTSKLLSRLERRGLIENVGLGHGRGAPNAWMLTSYGRRVGERIDNRGAAAGARSRTNPADASPAARDAAPVGIGEAA